MEPLLITLGIAVAMFVVGAGAAAFVTWRERPLRAARAPVFTARWAAVAAALGLDLVEAHSSGARRYRLSGAIDGRALRLHFDIRGSSTWLLAEEARERPLLPGWTEVELGMVADGPPPERARVAAALGPLADLREVKRRPTTLQVRFRGEAPEALPAQLTRLVALAQALEAAGAAPPRGPAIGP